MAYIPNNNHFVNFINIVQWNVRSPLARIPSLQYFLTELNAQLHFFLQRGSYLHNALIFDIRFDRPHSYGVMLP